MADKLKRFWKTVDLQPEEQGFGLYLDGRKAKTPLKRDLYFPSRATAEAAKAEWEAIKDVIRPDAMPVTRLAMTAIDAVS